MFLSSFLTVKESTKVGEIRDMYVTVVKCTSFVVSLDGVGHQGEGTAKYG